MIGSKDFSAIEAIKFTSKDPKDIKRFSNNVYVKNFDATWTDEKIRSIFSHFGLIKSVFVKEDDVKIEPKDGGEAQVVKSKFAFV